MEFIKIILSLPNGYIVTTKENYDSDKDYNFFNQRVKHTFT